MYLSRINNIFISNHFSCLLWIILQMEISKNINFNNLLVKLKKKNPNNLKIKNM